VPLTEVINMAVNIMQYDTDAKKRSIVKEFQTSPMIMLNRDKMIQVIINLIRNAVQATGPTEQLP
jgi:C4-dicarboxylate-specific signal transduction histidine kinase